MGTAIVGGLLVLGLLSVPIVLIWMKLGREPAAPARWDGRNVTASSGDAFGQVRHTEVHIDDPSIPDNIQTALRDVAKVKSAALYRASFRAHSACTVDPSRYGIADPQLKVVAIDAGFERYGAYFKPQDLELLDVRGQTGGSDPIVEFLDAHGMSIDPKVIDFDRLPPLRLRLTFVLPTAVTVGQLSYWGHPIGSPIALDEALH